MPTFFVMLLQGVEPILGRDHAPVVLHSGDAAVLAALNEHLLVVSISAVSADDVDDAESLRHLVELLALAVSGTPLAALRAGEAIPTVEAGDSGVQGLPRERLGVLALGFALLHIVLKNTLVGTRHSGHRRAPKRYEGQPSWPARGNPGTRQPQTGIKARLPARGEGRPRPVPCNHSTGICRELPGTGFERARSSTGFGSVPLLCGTYIYIVAPPAARAGRIATLTIHPRSPTPRLVVQDTVDKNGPNASMRRKYWWVLTAEPQAIRLPRM